MLFRLDDSDTKVTLNGTSFDDGPTLAWRADNLGDDDHQLWVIIRSLQQNGSVAVDYFEYVVPLLHLVTRIVFRKVSAFRVENSSGNGFDPLWAGPNATNVPKEAIIVDSSSPDIVFSTPSMWSSADDPQYYRRSLSYTTQAGASLSFSFDGVAIWYDCVSYA